MLHLFVITFRDVSSADPRISTFCGRDMCFMQRANPQVSSKEILRCSCSRSRGSDGRLGGFALRLCAPATVAARPDPPIANCVRAFGKHRHESICFSRRFHFKRILVCAGTTNARLCAVTQPWCTHSLALGDPSLGPTHGRGKLLLLQTQTQSRALRGTHVRRASTARCERHCDSTAVGTGQH